MSLAFTKFSRYEKNIFKWTYQKKIHLDLKLTMNFMYLSILDFYINFEMFFAKYIG